MPNPDLLNRLHESLRYRNSSAVAKPFVDPRRFLRNQLRKYGLFSAETGSLGTVPTFHLPDFTVVQGELVRLELACYGMFEPALTEAFIRLVEPGQTVVDIGMHLGYYTTLFALLVGDQGRVHAFEPTPSTREIALRNTARFPRSKCTPLPSGPQARQLPFRTSVPDGWRSTA